eukprot:11608631-Prorocentrum_lima.AAC.1
MEFVAFLGDGIPKVVSGRSSAAAQAAQLGRKLVNHHRRWVIEPEYRNKAAARGQTPWNSFNARVLPWRPLSANDKPPVCNMHDVQ